MLVNIHSINKALDISSGDYIEVEVIPKNKYTSTHRKICREKHQTILEVKSNSKIKYKKITPTIEECIENIFDPNQIDNIIEILKIKQEEYLNELRQSNIEKDLYEESLIIKEEKCIDDYIESLLLDQKEFLETYEVR